jgi:hypothetical protein
MALEPLEVLHEALARCQISEHVRCNLQISKLEANMMCTPTGALPDVYISSRSASSVFQQDLRKPISILLLDLEAQ